MTQDLTIVVRGAGERTEQLCWDALRAQTEAPIHTIHERPFTAALRKSIRLGIEGGRELTLCVDADIIFAPNGIERMVRRLSEDPGAFFTCGYFLDKYYGEPKSRGAHLYRTRFLEEAVAAIPASNDVHRPETAMKKVLLDCGHTTLTVEDCLLGLHGYGQFYRDTFRTIACRGQKSPDEFSALMKRFSRHAGHDTDLRVGLWALVAGTEEDFSLDAHHWAERVAQLMHASGLAEKGRLGPSDARGLNALARLAGHLPLKLWRQLKTVRGLLRGLT